MKFHAYDGYVIFQIYDD